MSSGSILLLGRHIKEYRALALVTSKLCWFKNLIKELQLHPSNPIIWCDNVGAGTLHHDRMHIEDVMQDENKELMHDGNNF